MKTDVDKHFMRTLGHILLPHVYVTGFNHTVSFEDDVDLAIDIAEELYTEGMCLPIIPHLLWYWHQRHAHSQEHWDEICFQMLKRCDAVLVYNGDGSEPVEQEAVRLGMPVFYSTDALTEWKETR